MPRAFIFEVRSYLFFLWLTFKVGHGNNGTRNTNTITLSVGFFCGGHHTFPPSNSKHDGYSNSFNKRRVYVPCYWLATSSWGAPVFCPQSGISSSSPVTRVRRSSTRKLMDSINSFICSFLFKFPKVSWDRLSHAAESAQDEKY